MANVEGTDRKLIRRVRDALRGGVAYPKDPEVAVPVAVVRLARLMAPYYSDGIIPRAQLVALFEQLCIKGDAMSILMKAMGTQDCLMPLEDGRVQLVVGGVAAIILERERTSQGIAEEATLPGPVTPAPFHKAVPQAIFRAPSLPTESADSLDEVVALRDDLEGKEAACLVLTILRSGDLVLAREIRDRLTAALGD